MSLNVSDHPLLSANISATDVATMILRIDDVIAAKQPEGPPPDGGDGMGGMPPGMM